MSKLSKLLGPYNLQIFELLINEDASVRDLAKKADCSPAKVTQFAELYTTNNLATMKRDMNRKVLALNKSSPLAREIITLIYLDKIISSKTFSALKRTSNSMGLYGSIADGNADKYSDIDLWIVSDHRKKIWETGKIRQQLTSELGREVSLKFYTSQDIENMKKKDKVFYNELNCKSKILHGEHL